ncbi:hypothetical protein [Salsuginibacillus kocurii]|uniref:hypothetical protein n=1 Tax=Salsuginibacillus kocurii TaxID=427078 RepID=UPI000380D165|nr:hypothetical protein [Salsuginibacillus kocurii]
MAYEVNVNDLMRDLADDLMEYRKLERDVKEAEKDNHSKVGVIDLTQERIQGKMFWLKLLGGEPLLQEGKTLLSEHDKNEDFDFLSLYEELLANV